MKKKILLQFVVGGASKLRRFTRLLANAGPERLIATHIYLHLANAGPERCLHKIYSKHIFISFIKIPRIEKPYIVASSHNYLHLCTHVNSVFVFNSFKTSERFCTDFRKVNVLTKPDSCPLPRIEDCINRIGHSKYISKFDMLKSYWQIPLSERAKEISTFATADGLFQYKVMLFGMRNAPIKCQRFVNQVTAEVEECEAYIDDVIIYSNNWMDHIKQIQNFL